MKQLLIKVNMTKFFLEFMRILTLRTEFAFACVKKRETYKNLMAKITVLIVKFASALTPSFASLWKLNCHDFVLPNVEYDEYDSYAPTIVVIK